MQHPRQKGERARERIDSRDRRKSEEHSPRRQGVTERGGDGGAERRMGKKTGIEREIKGKRQTRKEGEP